MSKAPSIVERQDLIRRYAPRIDAAEFAAACELALKKDTRLAQCSPTSLWGGVLLLARLGLEPNTPQGLAYMLPYRAKDGYQATVIIGYRGFVALLHRHAPDAVVHADVVYDGDDFQYAYGSDAYLRHIPDLSGGRARPLAAYAYVRHGASFDFIVLPWPEVEKIRDASQGYRRAIQTGESHPWREWTHQMASKTAIRALAKTANLGRDIALAAHIDARQEASPGDYTDVIELAGGGEGHPAPDSDSTA